MTEYNGLPDVFPSPFDDETYDIPAPRTLHELAMVKLSASIRAKADWWIKFEDLEIRAKWKTEALEQKFAWVWDATMLVPYEDRDQYLAKSPNHRDPIEVALSAKHVNYVLDELDGYAKLRDETTGIQVSCFDGIWHSDILIPTSLRISLIDGIRVLEGVSEDRKDWHPNSDDKVLDLVHPSLFPIVYGRTLGRYPDSSRPISPITSPFPEKSTSYLFNYRSAKFQWLPTDFQVAETGGVEALGYINNLHPSHEGLYRCVESVIQRFIPLWERVLSDILEDLPTRIPDSYLPIQEVDPAFPREDSEEITNAREGKDGEDGNERMDYWERVEKYYDNVWENDKIVGLPDVPEQGYPGGLENRGVSISLRGKKLQIIVKFANIHLSQEKPEFSGGSWHVEGMENEHIVASGIYYYDQKNITQSELAFRIAVDEPEPCQRIQAERYDYYAHEVTWGMAKGMYDTSTKLNNVVGATETREGRCIAFPNIYQHRVSPFRLEDPSKSGHRKILALFLVDPSIPPIPSTTNVPPQQASWAIQALGTTDSTAPVRRLPVEILSMIEKDLKLMDEREAKAIRIELMKERTVVMESAEEVEFLFSRVFNLCEH